MLRSLVAVLAVLPMLAPIGARAAEHVVSGQRIAAVAAREVATLAHDADHRYVAASTIADQIVAGTRVALVVQPPIGTASFVNVPVTIEADGKANRTIYVGYRVQQYVETAVASHDIVPGTVLSQDDLRMARVPYAGRPGNGIDALVGRKITTSVLKGQPIAIEATSVNQIVKPGATVLLIVRDNGVAVTADAVARTGGGLGDEVSVYNPATNKTLSGTVTAPGTVELDISAGDD